MKRVRFAPTPSATGGDWMLQRIDDTDSGRSLSVEWGEGPIQPAAGTGPRSDGVTQLARFRELREGANGGVERELKAVGGDLHALRRSLTGRDSGPELAAVAAALDRDETLRRLDASV